MSNKWCKVDDEKNFDKALNLKMRSSDGICVRLIVSDEETTRRRGLTRIVDTVLDVFHQD